MRTRFGVYVFDTDRRQLLCSGVEAHLTPKAFDLLALLIEQAPAVVTKATIHQRLWPDTFVADTTLVGLVKEVRRSLGDELIRTAHRVGYAFTGELDTPAPAVATPAVTYWLIVGERRISLKDGANVIGRDPAASVWLDVPGVSRRHAQVILDSGRATLEDLGSKNGTLLGDRPVRGSMPLKNADHIQIGAEELVFHVSGSGMSTATQPKKSPG